MAGAWFTRVVAGGAEVSMPALRGARGNVVVVDEGEMDQWELLHFFGGNAPANNQQCGPDRDLELG